MAFTTDKPGGMLHGFLHLFAALRYSLAGWKTCFRLSLAFRQELLTALALCGALFYWNRTPMECFLVLFCWGLVLVAEMINTALEETLDLITRDFSPSVKRAKDMASGAVFLLVLGNAGLWLALFVCRASGS